MGFFKNAIVKGLAGGAGALTLAVTKNPALAATASQLVNQHGHKLVDPAVKLLANHKFSFGKHKVSARDILHKVRKVKGMVEGESEGGLDVSGVRNKLARSGAMMMHDQLSRLGRNKEGYRFQNN
jgi:hypothetical protein